MDLFGHVDPIHKKYLPTITRIEGEETESNVWDIPSTIKELSYLVHSHYRYYGKFPPVVAGQLLEQFPPPDDSFYVLDNFCGSGTTLVEAKLRNVKSYGVDISWLSCLASNVKVTFVDTRKIRAMLPEISKSHVATVISCTPPDDAFVKKWFSEDATRHLSALREIIYELAPSNEKDFLLIAFIGILRRVSKAFDGEVRPHINKEKKQRSVFDAFAKKVQDMCVDHDDYMAITSSDVPARCMLANNLLLPSGFADGKCYLFISHPPYLNSFNYTPVYSLEFYWGRPFEKQYTGGIESLHKEELTAHPASEKITEQYFQHLEECYREAYRIQPAGAYLAIVIGDCTRNGELIDVLGRTIQIVTKLGYTPHQFNYRTTHFGLGKYAYRHRADYHGDAEKRDGILVFKR